jgi:hypothetical protein
MAYPGLVNTYITSTNTSVFDVHNNIMLAFKLRDRAVLVCDLVDSLEDERGVLEWFF